MNLPSAMIEKKSFLEVQNMKIGNCETKLIKPRVEVTNFKLSGRIKKITFAFFKEQTLKDR